MAVLAPNQPRLRFPSSLARVPQVQQVIGTSERLSQSAVAPWWIVDASFENFAGLHVLSLVRNDRRAELTAQLGFVLQDGGQKLPPRLILDEQLLLLPSNKPLDAEAARWMPHAFRNPTERDRLNFGFVLGSVLAVQRANWSLSGDEANNERHARLHTIMDAAAKDAKRRLGVRTLDELKATSQQLAILRQMGPFARFATEKAEFVPSFDIETTLGIGFFAGTSDEHAAATAAAMYLFADSPEHLAASSNVLEAVKNNFWFWPRRVQMERVTAKTIDAVWRERMHSIGALHVALDDFGSPQVALDQPATDYADIWRDDLIRARDQLDGLSDQLDRHVGRFASHVEDIPESIRPLVQQMLGALSLHGFKAVGVSINDNHELDIDFGEGLDEFTRNSADERLWDKFFFQFTGVRNDFIEELPAEAPWIEAFTHFLQHEFLMPSNSAYAEIARHPAAGARLRRDVPEPEPDAGASAESAPVIDLASWRSRDRGPSSDLPPGR